jgi:hypothetical protein
MNKPTITGRIYLKIFEILEKHPLGIRWTDLISKIIFSDPKLHPKTVNGCVWKIVEKFPDKVYKPSKGIFRLVKFKFSDKSDTGID